MASIAVLDAMFPEQNGSDGLYLNALRVWVLDWLEVNFGAERDFIGLKARCAGVAQLA
jgi:hypothetical protein